STPAIFTLSLHDALPIFRGQVADDLSVRLHQQVRRIFDQEPGRLAIGNLRMLQVGAGKHAGQYSKAPQTRDGTDEAHIQLAVVDLGARTNLQPPRIKAGVADGYHEGLLPHRLAVQVQGELLVLVRGDLLEDPP